MTHPKPTKGLMDKLPVRGMDTHDKAAFPQNRHWDPEHGRQDIE
jgi:hypothetical protein